VSPSQTTNKTVAWHSYSTKRLCVFPPVQLYRFSFSLMYSSEIEIFFLHPFFFLMIRIYLFYRL
jgi:hypothetical protein